MKTLRTLFLLAFLALATLNLNAEGGIRFATGTWTEILQKAASENKLVFVDAYAVWCGPCKWMAANTFTNAEVAEFYNTHFVNYKFDMEKGEGPGFAQKYGVNAYPTLLFVNAAGELVEKAIGARDVADFLAMGKKVSEPGFVSLPKLNQRYANGERDRQFLHDYILRLADAEMDYTEPLKHYREGTKAEAWLEEANWEIFNVTITATDAPEFQYVRDNRAAFIERYGEEKVMRKLQNVYWTTAYNYIRVGDKPAAEAAIAAAEKSDLFPDQAPLRELRLHYYERIADWDSYIKTGWKVVAKDNPGASAYNSMAWNVYEGSTEPKHLKEALQWAETSVSMEPNYYNLDTQAMLLHALGRKEDAIKAANAAIAKAKETGEDYSATEKAMQGWK